MKKYITLLIFISLIFTSCNFMFEPDAPYIVSRSSICSRGCDVKYYYDLKSVNNPDKSSLRIFTDQLFNVGDTIDFYKK